PGQPPGWGAAPGSSPRARARPSSSATAGPGRAGWPSASSPSACPFQPEFLGDAVDGPGKPLPQGLGAVGPLGRDLGPVQAGRPVLGQVPLTLRQPSAELAQQFRPGRLLAGAR